MRVRTGKIGKLLIAVLIVSSAAIFTLGAERRYSDRVAVSDAGDTTRCAVQEASQPKTNQRPASQRREENKRPPDATQYSWEFTQPQFYNGHILIEHNAAGQGKITFERLGQHTPIIEPIELSIGALGRILGLWVELRFLDSTADYQAPKQFPHLGTMRLHMENGDRKRTAQFNWTNNKEAAALNKEYHGVAEQAIFIFDMSVARENQPLNTPKLMEQLESQLTRGELSDPYQLVPLLRDLTTDEHVPLITRNHAARLLKRIQK